MPHHVLGRDQLGDPVHQFILVLDLLVHGAGFVEEGLHFVWCVVRPEERAALAVLAAVVTGFVQELVPHEERCAERAPGVARGGLDPDLVEG